MLPYTASYTELTLSDSESHAVCPDFAMGKANKNLDQVSATGRPKDSYENENARALLFLVRQSR